MNFYKNVSLCVMTIALFSDSYLPTKSGVVTVVMQLRDQLIKAGHKVLLITVETTLEYATDDPLIYRVSSRPLGLGTDQFISLPLLRPLLKFIKENNVDIIHCHTEFGIGRAAAFCAKTLHIPAICTTHTLWTDFYKYYIIGAKLIPSRVISKIMNRFYKKFDALIGVSSKARNYYKAPKMIPNMPSVIVPNAIDEKKFNQVHLTQEERKSIRAKYGISDDDVVLLFLGRIAEEKRVFELLKMCQKLVSQSSNCKVLFVGSGPAYKEMLERASVEIDQKKIIFTGFIEWANVHSFYESADIFISASLSEMHSMTILEAALSSLPIIVRRDESYFDVVFDNKNGFLCNDEDEMLEKILLLAKNKEMRKKFGEFSLKTTKSFSIANHIKRTLFVYDEVLKAYPKKINDVDVMERMSKEIL